MAYTPNVTLTGGGFTDFEGSPLNLGYLIMQLSHDEQYTVGPNQVVAGLKLKILLDANGNIPVSPATKAFANDAMLPSGSFYIVQAYKADGTQAWADQQFWTILSSPSTIDVGTIVPTNPPGGLVGGGTSTLLLETNGTNNSNQSLLNIAQGTGITITNVSGTTTITNTGGASFTTAGQGYFIGPGILDLTPLFTLAVSAFVNSNTSNSLLVYQFVLESTWTISKCLWQVTTTGSAGDLVMFGIYSASGNRLLSTAFDGTINTLQTNTFTPVTFAPGVYYFAAADSSSAGTRGPVVQLGSNVTNQMLNMLGTTSVITAVATNLASGGVLPATLGTLTAQTSGTASSGIPLPVWRV
jgi:hypothetical protein